MKPAAIVLTVALAALPTLAHAQSAAQDSFERLKALAGSWEGTVTTVPPMPEADGKRAQVTLRVTSMGNALLHEMQLEGRPDDPITMFYLEGDSLLLTHYCDAGNRPRMAGKASADGKGVEFDLLDVVGGTDHGHMGRAGFTVIDEDHHVEHWTFMLSGDQAVQARFDLQRVR